MNGPTTDTDVRRTTEYRFRHALGGFFALPVEEARALLPAELQPVEPHHGSGVFSVMAFDFHDSEVGAYREIIFAVLVSPRVEPGSRMPHSAFYPIRLATTTEASREHAIERWHLPHYMHDVEIDLEPEGDERVRLAVRDEHGPIVEMTLTSYGWRPNEQHHQSFQRDEEGFFLAAIGMRGLISESEEERGELTLHRHPMTEDLPVDEIEDVPFRELWMRDGRQLFQPLRTL